MNRKLAMGIGLLAALFCVPALSQTPTCADLKWSADVLAANPDIALLCQEVYEKDGILYAKTTIEVQRVRGNRIMFRPLRTDGSLGSSRSLRVDSGFRAEIGGRSYRVSELIRGQRLNVYLPEDRFALAIADADGPTAAEMIVIEEAVTMPKTASPLYLAGAAGAALLLVGVVLGVLRRRDA